MNVSNERYEKADVRSAFDVRIGCMCRELWSFQCHFLIKLSRGWLEDLLLISMIAGLIRHSSYDDYSRTIIMHDVRTYHFILINL